MIVLVQAAAASPWDEKGGDPPMSLKLRDRKSPVKLFSKLLFRSLSPHAAAAKIASV